MTARGVPSRGARAACAAALLLGTVGLTGCASSSYAGIPLAAGAADPELQRLARRAQAGNRQARLELGKRFEEGVGVERSRETACAVFTGKGPSAAREQWIYSPSAGKMEQYSRPGKADAWDELALQAYLCRASRHAGTGQ